MSTENLREQLRQLRAQLAAVPVEDIEALAQAVDELTFGQSRAARVVLDWIREQTGGKAAAV